VRRQIERGDSVLSTEEKLSVLENLQATSELDVFRFIPYYFRTNREGKGQMSVGLHISRKHRL
jgi:hypothetical protein